MSERVFILGAGFSKPAGFPLATELTDELLAEIRKLTGDDYDLLELAEDVRRLHGWISRSTSAQRLNIEEFYEYASNYAERFRLEQHREQLGRDAGETSYRVAEDIDVWMSVLDEHLLDVLLRHDAEASLSPITRFTESLHDSDTIVTFNYDRLVERACTLQGLVCSFGFEPFDDDTIRILKLHGSFDWLCVARDQDLQPNQRVSRLFSKTDLNQSDLDQDVPRSGESEYDYELWRITCSETLAEQINGRSLIQLDHYWALAGLGHRKKPSRIPGLGLIWESARKAIFHADVIALVGFSFSGYDRFAQIEIARVMQGREAAGHASPRVVLIDPIVDRSSGRMRNGGRALIKRIESVFRPVECLGVGHESVDWSKI